MNNFFSHNALKITKEIIMFLVSHTLPAVLNLQITEGLLLFLRILKYLEVSITDVHLQNTSGIFIQV